MTANDAGDGDTGANGLQNFPVLVSAYRSGTDTKVTGSLDSTAGTSFRIEFYSSPTGDSNGHGEGAVYLGATTVTTNGSGSASFTATLTGQQYPLKNAFAYTRKEPLGVCVGIPAFLAVIGSAPLASPPLFAVGTFLIGQGAGMFGHGTLTATMNLAPKDQAGLALGAWGAVQSTGAGLAMFLGGALRDGVSQMQAAGAWGADFADPALAYSVVYHLEMLLLFITLVVIGPLVRRHALARFFYRLALTGLGGSGIGKQP